MGQVNLDRAVTALRRLGYETYWLEGRLHGRRGQDHIRILGRQTVEAHKDLNSATLKRHRALAGPFRQTLLREFWEAYKAVKKP